MEELHDVQLKRSIGSNSGDYDLQGTTKNRKGPKQVEEMSAAVFAHGSFVPLVVTHRPC